MGALFRILHIYCSPEISQVLEVFAHKLDKSILLLQANTPAEAIEILEQQEIHFIALRLTDSPDLCIQFLQHCKRLPRHRHTPTMVFSHRMDHLIAAFLKVHFCEHLLLPLHTENLHILQEYIEHQYTLYTNLHCQSGNSLLLDCASSYRKIPIQDIFFIEAMKRKCSIYTATETFTTALPLYRIKENVPKNALVQSHRSFLINTANILTIDKTQEPWIVHFPNHPRQAFISRNFKKEVLDLLPIQLRM